MKARRTRVMFVIRSQAPSGRITAPIWPLSSWRFSNSGRTGGSRPTRSSAMGDPVRDLARRALVLDPLGEQHVVDVAAELDEPGALLLGMAELVAVELGLDPAGMRAEHQD